MINVDADALDVSYSLETVIERSPFTKLGLEKDIFTLFLKQQYLFGYLNFLGLTS